MSRFIEDSSKTIEEPTEDREIVLRRLIGRRATGEVGTAPLRTQTGVLINETDELPGVKFYLRIKEADITQMEAFELIVRRQRISLKASDMDNPEGITEVPAEVDFHYWPAFEFLVNQKVIVGGCVPIEEDDGSIGYWTFDESQKPKDIIKEAKQAIRTMGMLAAVVDTAYRAISAGSALTEVLQEAGK